MTKSAHKLAAAIAMLLSLFLLTGCTEVVVENNSPLGLMIRLTYRGRSAAATAIIQPGEKHAFASDFQGQYVVEASAEEVARPVLENLRDRLIDRYINLPNATEQDLTRLSLNLSTLGEQIRSAAAIRANCSGRVEVFETAVVVVSHDPSSDQITLLCPSTKGRWVGALSEIFKQLLRD